MNIFFSANLPSYPDLGFDFGGASIDLRTAELGTIFTVFLQYAFAIAGFILLGLIIASGFKLMTSGGDPETIARAKKKLTNAVIGFLIVISAYWLTQIAEIIFGLDITSGASPDPSNPPFNPPAPPPL